MPEANSSQQHVGKLAVERGLLSFEHLAEAIREHERRRASGKEVPFGDLLVEMELLTRRQLESLLAASPAGGARKQPIEGYELLRKLGEGGMGATYLARQLSMDKLVALKVLRRNLARSSDYLTRFQREARLAGRLDHPNIVRALDVGESGGFNFLVMEYVDGRSAYSLMSERGAIAESEALRLCLQVARALEYASRHGVVHRDVKPDNILVTADGTARLCDFGLARDSSAQTRLTQTGVTMGTPHYASPEQARGQMDVDVRSDIYSLGATLYHLVTGQPPFSGSSAAVVMTKHLTEQMPWPSDVNPAVSDNCSRLIARMMAKDPADRYRTAAELIADMQLVAGGMRPSGVELGDGRSAIALSGTIAVPRRPDPRRATVQVRVPVPEAEPGEFPEVDGVQWVDAAGEEGEAPLEAGDSGEPQPAAPFAIRRRGGPRGSRFGETPGRRSGTSGRLGFVLCVLGLLIVGGIVWLALRIAESRTREPESVSTGSTAVDPGGTAGGTRSDGGAELRKAVENLFRGKLGTFNPVTLRVELTYDFQDPAQFGDWQPGPDCRWAVEGGRLVCAEPKINAAIFWKGELDPQKVELHYTAWGERDLNCAVCCPAAGGDPRSTGWWAEFGAIVEKSKAQLGVRERSGQGAYIDCKAGETYRLAAAKTDNRWALWLGGAELISDSFSGPAEGRRLALWTRMSKAAYDNVIIRGWLDRAWLEGQFKAAGVSVPLPPAMPGK